MIKLHQLIAVSVISSFLSGCVTQSYENNDDNPVIENSSTNNEIASTRIALAMGYLNMGNTTQAKVNLEKAKRFAPNLTRVYTAYAHYYDAVEEPEQAVVAYDKALSIDPKDADTLNNYGVFLCKQKQYDESEKQMLKAIAVPTYILISKSYENLALCQLKAKHFEKAEMYLAKSISHSPSSSSALLQMLRLQYAIGNYDQAQVYLRRYEKSSRRFTPGALALAYKVFDKVRNKRAAKNYAGMLIKMFPNSYEANQYILNELKHIEADDLAADFLLAGGANKNKSKKRVMVLSPNQTTGISLKSKSVPSTEGVSNLVKKEKSVVKETTLIVNNLIPLEADDIIGKVLPKADNLIKDVSLENISDEVAQKKKEQGTTEAKSSFNEQGHQMLTLPIHLVSKGDTLFSISKKYNIKMYKIERWNGFKRTHVLIIGDVIYLSDPKKALKST